MTKRITLEDAGDNIHGGMMRANTPSASQGSWIKIFEVARLFLLKRCVIAGITVSVMLLTAGYMLLKPSLYESKATILPSGTTDRMAELKSLAGLGGLTATDENSSELFPSIIRSHLVMDAALNRTYVWSAGDRTYSMKPAEYFDTDDPDELRAELAAITNIHRDRKTGVITVRMRTEYPQLSQQMLHTCLTGLEDFNLTKRRSQGKVNAAYLARQLEDKKTKLQEAETRLEQFRRVNRDWAVTSDPEILTELARMQRDVEIRSRTYLFLNQEYEVAKLDAQKDIPIVRILDQPSLPTKKVAPKRALTVAVATVMAFILSLMVVIIGEVFRRMKDGPEQDSYRAFRSDFSHTFPRANRVLARLEREEAAAT